MASFERERSEGSSPDSLDTLAFELHPWWRPVLTLPESIELPEPRPAPLVTESSPPAVAFNSDIREVARTLVSQPSLSVKDIKKALLLAQQFGVNPDPFGYLETTLTLPPGSKPSKAAARLEELLTPSEGFMMGAKINPLSLTEISSATGLRDLVGALRKLGIPTIGLIYPRDRVGLQWEWRLLVRNPVV